MRNYHLNFLIDIYALKGRKVEFQMVRKQNTVLFQVEFYEAVAWGHIHVILAVTLSGFERTDHFTTEHRSGHGYFISILLL